MDPRIGRAETPRVLLDNVKTAAPNKRETRKPRTKKLPQGSRKKRGKHGFLGVGGLELSSVGAAERFSHAIPPWKTEKSLDHKKNKEARQYGSCPARRCLARNRRRSDPRSIADLGTDPGVRGAGCHRGCEGLGLFYANAHPLPFGLRQQATHLSAVISLHRITQEEGPAQAAHAAEADEEVVALNKFMCARHACGAAGRRPPCSLRAQLAIPKPYSYCTSISLQLVCQQLRPNGELAVGGAG